MHVTNVQVNVQVNVHGKCECACDECDKNVGQWECAGDENTRVIRMMNVQMCSDVRLCVVMHID